MADTATAPKPVQFRRNRHTGTLTKIVLIKRPPGIGGCDPFRITIARAGTGYEVTSRHPAFNTTTRLEHEARDFVIRQAAKVGGIL